MQRSVRPVWITLGDALVTNAGFILAFLIRFRGLPPAVNWRSYLITAPVITVVTLGLFWAYGLYSGNRRPWDEVLASVCCSVVISVIAAIAASYMLQQYAFPRLVFIITTPLGILLTGLWRWLVWQRTIAADGPLDVVVVGPLQAAEARADAIVSQKNRIYRLAGIITECSAGETLQASVSSPSVISGYDETAAALTNTGADAVLICPEVPMSVRSRVIAEAIQRRLVVMIIPTLADIEMYAPSLDQLDGIPIFRLRPWLATNSTRWKRAFDLFLALLAAVPATPIIALAALVTAIDSPGMSPFYLQERVTEAGRVFKLIKIRTMIADAEGATGPVLASEDDPRITRVGRILRRTRIDELPQIWNVIRGEMSFVGPRPERPYFVSQFSRDIPAYDQRHRVRAGITGLAQVSGKYGTTAEDKLRYDLIYVNTVSLWRDAAILLHTIRTMLLKDRAR
jgi:exopolysaccharide biosynthesis polyprenyl glycosylphosphotransferase